MSWPTKAQWKKGYRPCLKCDRTMKPGEYSKVQDPPEYSGPGYSWCHKVEVVCRFGYFHCPGEICEHKERNGLFGICVPDGGWIFRKARGAEKIRLKFKI